VSATFKRPSRRKNTADAVGRVVVTIVLQNPETKAHQTGNIVRSFSLDDTRVSVVADKLERVLGA
jgi:hypothetical protein